MTYQRITVKQRGEEDYILSEIQVVFLRLCCRDLPYWQIAEQMGKMPRTIDGYRDQMFDLLKVSSRTGIILWCFKSGFLKVKDIKMVRYHRTSKKHKDKIHRDRRGKEIG